MSEGSEALKENREAVLLAEVAAWLHDMGKCDDRQVIDHSKDKAGTIGYDYKTAHTGLVGTTELELLGEKVTLARLIEKGTPGNITAPGETWLLTALGRCHNAAHTEKEEKYLLRAQLAADTRIGNAFGCEGEPVAGLEKLLHQIPFDRLQQRNLIKAEIKNSFLSALGDTRRPDNELTLWEWSNAVAALYKAALAAALLGNKPEPKEIKWRLLSLRFDGQEALARATKLPDILARQKIIEDGLNRVKTLLEETYPVGSEIYRDSNGSIYIVADKADLLTSTYQKTQTLEALIHVAFSGGTIQSNAALRLGGEIALQPNLDAGAWRAQPVRSSGLAEELPPIQDHLAQAECQAVTDAIKSWWPQKPSSDLCSVCQLRPQGKEDKERERKVCRVCERRREDRSKLWASAKLDTTIWIDEIADVNGRVALVVGSFDLTQWQSGETVFYPRSKEGKDNWDKWPTPRRAYRFTRFDEAGAGRASVKLYGQDYEFDQSAKLIRSIQPQENQLALFRKATLQVTLPGKPVVDFTICEAEKIDEGKVRLGAKEPIPGWTDEVGCTALGKNFAITDNGRSIIAETRETIGVVNRAVLHDGLLLRNPAEVYPTEAALTLTRLQSIWKTTGEFWHAVGKALGSAGQAGKIPSRLRIMAKFTPVRGAQEEKLVVSHAYEISWKGFRLGVVCVGKNEASGQVELLSAENLQGFAKVFGAPKKNQESNESAAEWSRTRLTGEEANVEEPTGYGSANLQRGQITIIEVTLDTTAYTPAITILTEPRQFMALVPADCALAVVEAIKQKYETEMGKVRNRLPLHVGAVFAGSRTPLAALLDAGRRMLNYPSQEQAWTVASVAEQGQHRIVQLMPPNDNPHAARARTVEWRVPTKMGDGVTTDDWYPYFFTDAPLGAYARMFEAPNKRHLVHVNELRGSTEEREEKVWVQPSTFDFEWLDSAARRFEVSYQGGRRRGVLRPARPYLLEEVTAFICIWKTLSAGLTTAQIKQVNELIESKRRAWLGERVPGEDCRQQQAAFAQLAADALANAKWKAGKRPANLDELAQAATSGLLADVIELFMQICKCKPKADERKSDE